jgi:hydrogenase expression/formation protein HypD
MPEPAARPAEKRMAGRLPAEEVARARALLAGYHGPRLNFMEVCGTHTAAIAAGGVRSLLTPSVRLVSGPGCPVCVTPAGYIDRLCDLATRPGYLVACFGDLIRVPGSQGSLGQAVARGGQVRMIYSPLDTLELCRQDQNRTVVLAAVGFETTAPSYALLLERARVAGITNLRLLTALRRMPPALEMLCRPEAAIDGFLAPGHVSAIIGSDAYLPLARQSGKPFVIAGFTPEQVIVGLAELVVLCSARRASAGEAAKDELRPGPVVNLYPAVVKPEGNARAQAVLARAFVTRTAVWRGLGPIDDSGFSLAPEYAGFDAGAAAGLADENANDEPAGCRCGEILLGRIEPAECPLFGKACRPETPIGPCMVSTEGACGIHFRYGAHQPG